MSRKNDLLDAVIVGGGVVGAACTLALTEAGLQVALVESKRPVQRIANEPDLRIYAIAPDNAALLQQLQLSLDQGQAYRRMCVWDASSEDELVIDADTLARQTLGWFIENDVLIEQLWARLQITGVQLHSPARVIGLEQNTHNVQLTLEDGARIKARIAIAADGANSTLRTLAGLTVNTHAYQQSGVVAYIETEHSHQQTAWQRFLPTGSLAFLPYTHARSSIVWALPTQEAERVLALDETQFNTELTQAFAGRLGQVKLVSKRAAFPLRRQLVNKNISGRILVIGDAAHAVHPLAGQGVNLGLRDVAALQALVSNALQQKIDWAAPDRLARWARTRTSENTIGAYTYEAINRVFSNDAVLPTLLRGRLLGLGNKLPMLKSWLWQQASR